MSARNDFSYDESQVSTFLRLIPVGKRGLIEVRAFNPKTGKPAGRSFHQSRADALASICHHARKSRNVYVGMAT